MGKKVLELSFPRAWYNSPGRRCKAWGCWAQSWKTGNSLTVLWGRHSCTSPPTTPPFQKGGSSLGCVLTCQPCVLVTGSTWSMETVFRSLASNSKLSMFSTQRQCCCQGRKCPLNLAYFTPCNLATFANFNLNSFWVTPVGKFTGTLFHHNLPIVSLRHTRNLHWPHQLLTTSLELQQMWMTESRKNTPVLWDSSHSVADQHYGWPTPSPALTMGVGSVGRGIVNRSQTLTMERYSNFQDHGLRGSMSCICHQAEVSKSYVCYLLTLWVRMNPVTHQSHGFYVSKWGWGWFVRILWRLYKIGVIKFWVLPCVSVATLMLVSKWEHR